MFLKFKVIASKFVFSILERISISKPFKGANQFDLEFETKKIMKSAPELFQQIQQSLGKDRTVPREISEEDSR